MVEERFPSSEGGIIYRRQGRIAHIVFDRPDKLNAFSDGQVAALGDALFHFDTDDDAWVAIMSGAGRAFSTGADVHQRQLRDPAELKALGGPEGRGANIAQLLYRSVNWKPVIAAVHGYAMGLAFGLMIQADMAVVTEEAKLQITEVSRGVGGETYWRRLHFLGAGVFASDVVLTGRFFTGREAADARIVQCATPEGKHVEVAQALAEDILKNPPLSVRAVVRARRYYMQQSEAECALLREGSKLHLSEDFRESALAFAERRPPRPYVGR